MIREKRGWFYEICAILLLAFLLLQSGCDRGDESILLSGGKLYSQGKEELIIRHFFGDKRNGFFADLGCAWPIRNSTTYYLEKHLGWSGIAVDALDVYGEAWRTRRPRSRFVNRAISDVSGETITFYRNAWPGVSSVSKEQSAKFGGEEKLTPIQVQTITIDDLLEQHGVEKIDHLTIDIEGHEPVALAAFDIQRFRPELVCIEAHTGGGENEAFLRSYFERNGYRLLEEYLEHDPVNWYFAPRTRGDP